MIRLVIMSTTPSPTQSADFSPNNPTSERYNYPWKNSFRDWYRNAWSKDYSDEEVEKRLLALLPFYPETDGKRVAKVINTDIGNGNHIHEFYIENTEASEEKVDIVLVHGYAASLGLFIENFDSLSSVPGVRIHALDLLGFGFSSRPRFPNFDVKTKEDIFKTEDWFIDSLEEWRKRKNINKFVLMGHSLGGYLSCAYALKYNKKILDGNGVKENLILKLVLISPVGLERNRFSVVRNAASTEGAVSNKERQKQNEQPAKGEPLEHDYNFEVEDNVDQYREKRSGRILSAMWSRNLSPFTIIRNVGPAKSKFISNWTTWRFANIYLEDPAKFQIFHDYIYRVFNGKGSGEYSITRLLAFGAMPRYPLLDRCPQKFVDMNLPTLWLYGDRDWMDDKAGLHMTKEINTLSKKANCGTLAEYAITPDSGHHLYLDNPVTFAKQVFKFLGMKR